MVTQEQLNVINNYPIEVQEIALGLWERLFPTKALNLAGIIALMDLAEAAYDLRLRVDRGHYREVQEVKS